MLNCCSCLQRDICSPFKRLVSNILTCSGVSWMLILSVGRGGGVTERLIVDQKVRCHMTSTTEIQIHGRDRYCSHKRSESAWPSLSTLISATGSLGSGCAIPFSLVEGVSSTS